MPTRTADTVAGTADRPRVRRRTYEILERSTGGDRTSRVVDLVLIGLIVGSVVSVILESIPEVEIAFAETFHWLEAVIVAVFTVEYLMRAWCVVEDAGYREQGLSPARARMQYLLSPYALIDLVAILPYYVVTILGLGGVDMRIVRCVRLMRVFKLTRYSRAFDILLATFRDNVHALAAAFVVLLTVMLIASTGMYFFEREAQPVAFRSIPDAMWWGVSTLTTVGYGDVTPITAAGKAFGALVTLVGVGMVALPTGILASGYAAQSKLMSRQFRRRAELALEDGIVSEDEARDLESLRRRVLISRETAQRIVDLERTDPPPKSSVSFCRHCGAPLDEESGS